MGPVHPSLLYRDICSYLIRSHPYYDPKSKEEDPTWYMVSVRFISRLPHPPSLALVKFLATASTMPDEVKYIGDEGFKAVQQMQLVNRGRLSMFLVDGDGDGADDRCSASHG